MLSAPLSNSSLEYLGWNILSVQGSQSRALNTQRDPSLVFGLSKPGVVSVRSAAGHATRAGSDLSP